MTELLILHTLHLAGVDTGRLVLRDAAKRLQTSQREAR